MLVCNVNLVEQNQTNNLSEKSILFDIGANVGFYTFLAAKKLNDTGMIFSFEPVLRNLSYLYRHLELNGLKNVVVIPLACSDENSLEKFFFDSDSALGHMIESKEIHNFNFRAYTYVQTITLDSFVSKSGIAPDLIKIDVEGSELKVLKGAVNLLKERKPKIFLSIHSAQLEIDCIKYLECIDYKYKLVDEKEKPSVEYLFF